MTVMFWKDEYHLISQASRIFFIRTIFIFTLIPAGSIPCVLSTLIACICRLWYTFLGPPRIDLTARPVLGGRALRFGALLDRVSGLLRNKLLKAVHRQLVSNFLCAAGSPLQSFGAAHVMLGR